uniref:CRC domain-containing protein n=1 Tax=Ananas comosus var. bracteatus TaxID=296719 RepID=A0A6V7NYW4_ANACO|nr:unnamed protein product [Ananas comosus var. bracteatus]
MAEGPNCKCVKSQCLQLYCGCLSRGRYCDERCGCKNCHNNKEHKGEVSDIIARKEISNRHAFNVDHTKKSGCNCEKSRCIKRYCECYKIFLLFNVFLFGFSFLFFCASFSEESSQMLITVPMQELSEPFWQEYL